MTHTTAASPDLSATDMLPVELCRGLLSQLRNCDARTAICAHLYGRAFHPLPLTPLHTSSSTELLGLWAHTASKGLLFVLIDLSSTSTEVAIFPPGTVLNGRPDTTVCTTLVLPHISYTLAARRAQPLLSCVSASTPVSTMSRTTRPNRAAENPRSFRWRSLRRGSYWCSYRPVVWCVSS